jgi:hypothetical protein
MGPKNRQVSAGSHLNKVSKIRDRSSARLGLNSQNHATGDRPGRRYCIGAKSRAGLLMRARPWLSTLLSCHGSGVLCTGSTAGRLLVSSDHGQPWPLPTLTDRGGSNDWARGITQVSTSAIALFRLSIPGNLIRLHQQLNATLHGNSQYGRHRSEFGLIT